MDISISSDWTLFLDRDGVINERILGDYVKNISEFHFREGALEAIKGFMPLFQYIFVVTNQQGIGKGIMTEGNLRDVHSYMIDQVTRMGGKIDKCYHAPDLAGEDNLLRKPKPGMALLAAKEFSGINFSRSLMVGDSDSDIVFGKNLGMKTVRIKTVEPIGVEADWTCNSLLDLYKCIR